MSILGRKKKSRPQADRQPAERPSRPPRQPTLDSPQTTLDPMKVWRAFKPKTLLYARLWLETGELPVSCHFVIRERLEPWIAAVIAGGPELRDALVAAVPPIPPRAPVPTRGWVMPTSHRLEGSRRSTDDPSQIRPAEILAF